jgi:deoxyribodipyrimidine photo-lyase
MPATLVWLRNDLRLADHAPLAHAAARGAVVPVFVWDPGAEGAFPPGGAHRWWLHHSLAALDADLRARGLRLTLRRGPAADALRRLAAETGADAVVWHTPVEPDLAAHAARVVADLAAHGLDARAFAGRLLHDPDDVQTGSGGFYKVFTPFWKKLQAELAVPAPLPAPALGADHAPAAWPGTLPLDDLGLTPLAQDGVDWGAGLDDTWTPGEAGAAERLAAFVAGPLDAYPDGRNVPAERGSSMLSPHLHWGEVSPRQIWHAVQARADAPPEAARVFLSEIAWREFAAHVLHHVPQTPTEPLKPAYAAFPWRTDPDALRAWQRGRTGYPIVDAGMRQLWATGWMHNRVRMIVASFLTKDLLIPWQDGARWFWDTLVDGDLASNTMGWQWAAGCGADAQPFFRIFNPVSQGERFDAQGAYVRRWVPELASLPPKWIHRPWDAPEPVLRAAGVALGRTYPRPMVDHAEARRAALDALQQMNG